MMLACARTNVSDTVVAFTTRRRRRSDVDILLFYCYIVSDKDYIQYLGLRILKTVYTPKKLC
jgi:hypothetical protein